MLSNRPNSQTPQCICSISHNVSFRTEMCTFLFWMVHCGIWNRCIVRFVRLVYWFSQYNKSFSGGRAWKHIFDHQSWHKFFPEPLKRKIQKPLFTNLNIGTTSHRTKSCHNADLHWRLSWWQPLVSPVTTSWHHDNFVVSLIEHVLYSTTDTPFMNIP